ncbi:hypothetical protein [Luteitalea sp.]|jgi:hypothetical protein|uniref:hypothetical protein n=1 Tax=Luteitalea sp. TaxID=2004800 RepID=UPI0037C73DA0
MERRLWFGAAMICAFGSIFAGMFGLQWVQYPLIGLAVVAVFLAFRADPPPPVEDPRRRS